MNTLILNDNDKDISLAAQLILEKQVVAVPTETVYGLAANALDAESVEKIYLVKGRPQDNPLIVHISKEDQLNQLTQEISPLAQKLMKAFWPGPLTIIFKATDAVPKNITGGLLTVGVRMPNNPLTLKLIDRSGVPLAAPSANLSGKPSSTRIDDVLFDFDKKISAVIDGGECVVGIESTVVELSADKINILRPGAVTKEQLEKVTGIEVKFDKGNFNEVSENEAVSSPGMKYKHYSPKANVFIVSGDFEKYKNFLNTKDPKKTLAVCFNGEAQFLNTKSVEYGKETEAEAQAKALFAILRDADKSKIKEIYFRKPSQEGIGFAVINRLIRAAGFKVIDL